MDAGRKKHLIGLFMEGQPTADPNKRWTRSDVKAIVYSFIADSYGQETYSSATDTICRERIWGKLEEHTNDAREYLEGEDFRYQISEPLGDELEDEHKKENPRFDEKGEEDPYFYYGEDEEINEEKDRQLSEFQAQQGVAIDRINEELPSILPGIIRDYLQENLAATYTRLLSPDANHEEEIVKRVKSKMTWAFASD